MCSMTKIRRAKYFGYFEKKNKAGRVFIYILLAARMNPVAPPLAIAFHGSSFPRARMSMHSNEEKARPHAAKLPATDQGILVFFLSSADATD